VAIDEVREDVDDDVDDGVDLVVGDEAGVFFRAARAAASLRGEGVRDDAAFVGDADEGVAGVCGKPPPPPPEEEEEAVELSSDVVELAVCVSVSRRDECCS
jgi:hypothetical protein